MYTLLICADVYSDKINLEVTFPHMPTIGDLNRRVTEIFNAEAALKRPEGYPVVNFAISKLQIYDDVMLKWTDLVTCSQLHEYDQLYAFQPQSPWHSDIQKDLPPPRPPTIVQRVHSVSYSQQQQQQQVTDYATPYRAGGASPSYVSGSAANVTSRGSPTQLRLEEQRRKEEALRQELRRIHEETERLEAQAQREREEEARRQQEEADRALRQKEEDIRAQREALQRAEEELIRMQSGGSATATPQRTLYR